MSFGDIINSIIIGPLKLLFEFIFSTAYLVTENVALSIILLSLVINVLVLPLYMCADKMQERAQKKQAELQPGISHIKKTFKGDERMMMIQTYYKQNHYSPMSALSGSVSLLLEIPFFIAAYQFLSNLNILQGASLGFITDLGDPDSWFKIGSFTVNLLPILMTAINIIASVLYLKGAPLKSKIQVYAMAIFFLIFLYDSPSGLVFYWTLNNVFSLIKTIFYKLKNPKKVIIYLLSISGIALFIYAFSIELLIFKIVSLVVGPLLQLPIIIYYLLKKFKKPRNVEYKPNRKMFMIACVFLTILIGMLIPSVYIAASPQEFVNVHYFVHPIWYVVSSTCVAVGIFLVWLQVFYWLASPKGKVMFDRALCITAIIMLVDYLFFGLNLGILSSSLQYENRLFFEIQEYVINTIVVIAVGVGMYFLVTRFKKVTTMLLVIAVVAVGGMFGVNTISIVNGVSKVDRSEVTETMPSFELSTNGNNVVVLLLDRAMGSYMPYLLNEKPELREMFEGFTYYPNTISHGGATNFGSPGTLGGYEYTPLEMNKRDDTSLKEKQNEANMVMPLIFSKEGYQTTVYDPVYVDYQWISDVSIFENHSIFSQKPEYSENKITAENIIGKFNTEEQQKALVDTNLRNFFCFSLMKSMPVVTQYVLYNNGHYNKMDTTKDKNSYTNQAGHGISKASGIKSTFMDNYNVLVNLNSITTITDNGKNNFLFMYNNICHEGILVDETTYEPAWQVDNTEYDKANKDRFINSENGVKLNITNYDHMRQYQANMVALLKVASWLEYLKENNVFDNTKIIITSDHGHHDGQIDEIIYNGVDMQRFNPLLMVKDFTNKNEGYSSLQISNQFMTNADVPTLAVQGLIENAVNPFTNNLINNDYKDNPQYIILSRDWNTNYNDGNQFNASKWISVTENSLWGGTGITYYNKKTTRPDK